MISMRTPEHYIRHQHINEGPMHYQELYYIKCVRVTYSTRRAKSKLGRRETKRFSATSGALCQVGHSELDIFLLKR